MDGQVVWSGRPGAGAMRNAFPVSQYGGKNAGPHGEHEAAVTPSRREGRFNSAEPVVPAPVHSCSHGGRGCQPALGFPCALVRLRAIGMHSPDANRVAGRSSMFLGRGLSILSTASDTVKWPAI